MTANPATNVASALAALQSQLPLGPLLLPNHLALGNLAGITSQDLTVLQQAFQQVQQVSLQQQLQSYMELLHSSANTIGQAKNANNANAQVQAAAQFFQVCINTVITNQEWFCSIYVDIFLGGTSCTTITSITKTAAN